MARPAPLYHISKESFFIDNTNPNREDDPQIVSWRAELSELTKEMPYINERILKQALLVEQKVNEMVKKKGIGYVNKKRFKKDICGAICHFNDRDDFKKLLHFLQARGRVIYQDLPEYLDGLVVLNPQRLIKILCEIITAKSPWENDPVIQEDYQFLRGEGLLSQQLLNRAFEHLQLNDIRDSLIHIMERCDAICNSKNCKGEDYPYLVPCMLKSPKKNTRDTNMRNGPLPVFLTLNTNYIPKGRFCKVVVHFWEWATQLCGSYTAPSLFANTARFNVSKVYQLTLECHKTVIELKIWTRRDSDKVEERRICEELLSHLERCRTEPSITCPWLRSFTKLFVKCQLCEPCPDKCRGRSNICILHKKKSCPHFDCGHYIPLRSFCLSCEHSVDDVPDYPAEKLDPWVQALESIESKKRTSGRNEESSPRDALIAKKRKSGFAGGSPKDALTPKKRKTGFAGGSPKDALTPKKRKTGFAAVGSAKYLRRSKVKRRNKELSPNYASTPKKRKTGFAVMDKVASNEELEWLSQKLERWKTFGRRLKIEDEKFTAFDNDNKEFTEKIYKMLLYWKKREGSGAKLEFLYDALCHRLVDRRDLAEELLSLSRQSLLTLSTPR